MADTSTNVKSLIRGDFRRDVITIPLRGFDAEEQLVACESSRKLGGLLDSTELVDGVLTCRIITGGNSSKADHSMRQSLRRLRHFVYEAIMELRAQRERLVRLTAS